MQCDAFLSFCRGRGSTNRGSDSGSDGSSSPSRANPVQLLRVAFGLADSEGGSKAKRAARAVFEALLRRGAAGADSTRVEAVHLKKAAPFWSVNLSRSQAEAVLFQATGSEQGGMTLEQFYALILETTEKKSTGKAGRSRNVRMNGGSMDDNRPTAEVQVSHALPEKLRSHFRAESEVGDSDGGGDGLLQLFKAADRNRSGKISQRAFKHVRHKFASLI